jgi:3-dehydroquinate dehydratase II
MLIHIINGPNLNLTGTREPEVYGHQTFEQWLKRIEEKYPAVKFHYFQSNIEGELIDQLHQSVVADGIILNAGAYTHTSLAIGDAVAAIKTPVIEVHLSHILSREPYRHHSFIAHHCIGHISGFGLRSYELAIQYFTGE